MMMLPQVCIRVAGDNGFVTTSSSRCEDIDFEEEEKDGNLRTMVVDDSVLVGGKKFRFDRVVHAEEEDGQFEVFNAAGRRLVDHVLENSNTYGLLFCYGQPNTDKFYTVFGSREDASNQGVFPRVVNHLFEEINRMEHESACVGTVSVKMFEVYNEQIDDAGSIQEEVGSSQDTLDLVYLMLEKRRRIRMKKRDGFSLSHFVVNLTVEIERATTDAVNRSELIFVDLAESQTRNIPEARFINKSLLTLGEVLAASNGGERKSIHVPFRDSKLTKYLEKALTCPSRLTSVVATISTETIDSKQTLSTLEFCARAKMRPLESPRSARKEKRCIAGSPTKRPTTFPASPVKNLNISMISPPPPPPPLSSFDDDQERGFHVGNDCDDMDDCDDQVTMKLQRDNHAKARLISKLTHESLGKGESIRELLIENEEKQQRVVSLCEENVKLVGQNKELGNKILEQRTIIDQLRQAKEKLIDLSQKREEEIRSLTDQLAKTKGELTITTNEFQTLSKSSEEVRIRCLNQELEAYALKNEISLRDANDEAVAKLLEMCSEKDEAICRMSETNDELKAETQYLEEQLELRESRVNELEESNSYLEKQLENRDQEMEDIRGAQHESILQMDQLNAQNEHLQMLFHSTEEELGRAREELKKLKGALGESIKEQLSLSKEMGHKDKLNEKQITELNDTLHQRNLEMARIREESHRLYVVHQETNDTLCTMQKVNVERESQVSALKQEMEAMRKTIIEREQMIDNMSRTQTDIKRQNDKLEAERETLVGDIARLQGIVDDHEATVTELRKQHVAVINEKDAAYYKLADEQTEKDLEMAKMIQSYEEELQLLRKEQAMPDFEAQSPSAGLEEDELILLASSSSSSSSSEHDHQDEQEQQLLLMQNNESAKSKLKESFMENHSRLLNLQEECTAQRKEILGLQIKLATKERQCEELTQEVKSLCTERNDAFQQVETLKRDCKKYSERFANVEKERDTKIKEASVVQMKFTSMEQELNEARKESQSKTMRLKTVQVEHEASARQIRDLKRLVEQLKETHDKELERLTKQCTVYENRMESLEKEREKLQNEKSAIQTQSYDILEKAQNERGKLEAFVQELLKQKDNLMEELNHQRVVKTKLETEFQAYQQQVNKKSDQKANLLQSLHEKCAQIQAKQDALSSTKPIQSDKKMGLLQTLESQLLHNVFLSRYNGVPGTDHPKQSIANLSSPPAPTMGDIE